jgi:hypothetical protein|nr:MAG TPA: DNA-directed RNA polymerase [Caudoviricetes sp.]
MSRYIDAEKLTDSIFDWDMTIEDLYYSLCKLVDDVPTADVQEVKRGYWIPERDPDENNRIQCFHCSVCDDDFHYIGAFVATKFCPNCGARMD